MNNLLYNTINHWTFHSSIIFFIGNSCLATFFLWSDHPCKWSWCLFLFRVAETITQWWSAHSAGQSFSMMSKQVCFPYTATLSKHDSPHWNKIQFWGPWLSDPMLKLCVYFALWFADNIEVVRASKFEVWQNWVWPLHIMYLA